MQPESLYVKCVDIVLCYVNYVRISVENKVFMYYINT